MNWSDYFVIGLIAVFAIIGLYKGFIMSIYRLVAFVACIYASVKFSPVLADILEKTPVFEWIKNAVVKNLSWWSREAFATSSTGSASGSAGAEAILGAMPLPDFFKRTLLGNLPPPSELTNAGGIVSALGEELARMIISVLSLIALYIILRIILSLAGLLLRGISNLPVFKQVNKLGGFMLGGIQGILAVYVLCAALVLFNSNPGFAKIFDGLEASLFARNFYENNFIINWLFPGAVL